MEIELTLVLSTAHLTEEACNRFLPETDGAYEKADYGWFVYVPPKPDGNCPHSLADCFEFAKEMGCQWIMFDRDADTIEELTVYEW